MEGAPAGTAGDEGITPAELRLAARNHGLPLEVLRHPITPAGLHYLLIHYDIPAVDPNTFQLEIDGAVERPQTLSSMLFGRGNGSTRPSPSSAQATAGPCSSRDP